MSVTLSGVNVNTYNTLKW